MSDDDALPESDGGSVTWEDPIVAEVHRIRREIMAGYDGDMDAYCRHIEELEEEERKRGRAIVDVSQRGRGKPDAA